MDLRGAYRRFRLGRARDARERHLAALLGAAPRWASMRPPEWRAALEELCARYLTPASVVVELGSYAGESTSVFARHAGTVYAVDPWPADYVERMFSGCTDAAIAGSAAAEDLPSMAAVEALFDARAALHPNIVKVKAPEELAVERFEGGSVDLVYIDAMHTYDAVRASIAAWEPKLRRGGVMAGHDFAIAWPGVVRAVCEAYGRPDATFGDTSWAVRPAGRPA